MKKPPKDLPTEIMPESPAEEADSLVMRIVRIAELATQCDREGNPATAVSLRRVAEALWGEAFKRQARARNK